MKKLYFLFLLAVFVVLSGPNAAADTVDDVFTVSLTKATTNTYTAFTGVTITSDAVYAGKNAYNNGQLQLRSSGNDCGVVTTASGGKVTKVTVDWASGTSANRILNVYGSNTAYSAASDLYNSSKQGTLLGTIKMGTTELTIDGDYTYIGFRSNSGAMYLNSVTITWETGGESTTTSAPTFSLAAGDVMVGTEVTLATATEGASISYKIGDATEWTAYNGPITLDTEGSTTITAKTNAYGDLAESAEVSRTYNVIGVYDCSSLADFVTKGKADATKYYRLAFPVTVIDQYITKTPYNNIYVVDAQGNGTLIYYSGDKTEYTPGATLAAGIVGKFDTYTGSYELLPVTMTEATDGTLPEPTELVISEMTQDNQGRYVKLTGVTYDGTNFVSGEESVAIHDKLKKDLSLTSGKKYNVIALTAYYIKSGETTGTMQVYPISAEEVVDQTKVATPTADTAEGTYTDDITVKLACATEGATILYKVDDAADWTTYTDAGIVLKGGSEAKTYTVTAKATADGLSDSEEATFTYTINYFSGAATLVVEDYADANGWTNATAYENATVDVVTFSATKGGNLEPKYYTSDETWRVYNGSTFTVSVPEGYAISKITFTMNDTNDFSSADSGTYASKTWTAADGASTSSVAFSAGQTIKIQKVNVEYTIVPSVKVEVYEMDNKTATAEWLDITNETNNEYITDKTVTQVRVTFTPAIAGRTSTIAISDVNETVSELLDYTVTADNKGVYTYTFPESADDFKVEVEFDSSFYGSAKYLISAANTSSVDGVAADASKVVAVEGGIEISAAASEATVYDAAGRMVARTAVNGKTTVALSRGLYIVALNGKAVKVAVR